MTGNDQQQKTSGGAADSLIWKENSKAMYEATLKAAPFFVRKIIEKRLLGALKSRPDAAAPITEEGFFAALREVTPASKIDKILSELEPLKSK